MGVKVPMLSPPPPKERNHRSSLTPGCYRQRAVRRAEKVPPRGGTGATGRTASRRAARTARREERSQSLRRDVSERASSPSSRMLLASRGPVLLLRQVSRLEVVDVGTPGSVRLAARAARPPRPRLFRPLPPCGPRLVRPSSAALRPVVAMDHHLEGASVASDVSVCSWAGKTRSPCVCVVRGWIDGKSNETASRANGKRCYHDDASRRLSLEGNDA